MRLTVFGPGHPFRGGIARATTALVVQPATAIVIQGDALRKLLEQNEHMGCLVMKNLSGIVSARLSYITLVLGSEVTRFRKTSPAGIPERKRSFASRIPFGSRR